MERRVRRDLSLWESGEWARKRMEMPNIRSVALDLAEEKGNAAEGAEVLRTCRSGVTERRWDIRSHRTSSGGTNSYGAIKEPKRDFEIEPVEAKPALTPNESS